MKILVLGDKIFDEYDFCDATRLCPEAPAPVLVRKEHRTTVGGAALVEQQIRVLLGDEPWHKIVGRYGSVSNKWRIFADRTLICRIDADSEHVVATDRYQEQIAQETKGSDAIVIADYGKGAMDSMIVKQLMLDAAHANIPVFVDAKRGDPMLYAGAFAIFPNEQEHMEINTKYFGHVIRKLGDSGCKVDGYHCTTMSQHVYDVTGAGDIFLAAFVVEYLRNKSPEALREAGLYANHVAGLSVMHLGTYVVPLKEIWWDRKKSMQSP